MQSYNKTIFELKGKKYILLVLSMLAVSIFIWTIAIIFTTQTKTTVEKRVLEATLPLKPQFNTQLLDKMSSRRQITDQELESFKIRIFKNDEKSKTKSIVIIEN